jgi:hypothetical protein
MTSYDCSLRSQADRAVIFRRPAAATCLIYDIFSPFFYLKPNKNEIAKWTTSQNQCVHSEFRTTSIDLGKHCSDLFIIKIMVFNFLILIRFLPSTVIIIKPTYSTLQQFQYVLKPRLSPLQSFSASANNTKEGESNSCDRGGRFPLSVFTEKLSKQSNQRWIRCVERDPCNLTSRKYTSITCTRAILGLGLIALARTALVAGLLVGLGV